MNSVSTFRFLVASCLCVAAIGANGQTPPKDALKEIEAFRQGYTSEALAQIKASKTLAQVVDMMNQHIRERAEAALKGVDPSKINAKEAYDYGRVYALAGQHKTVCELAKAYLSTRPEPSSKFDAQLLLMDSLQSLGDGRSLNRVLGQTYPKGTAESLLLASKSNGYSDSIAKSVDTHAEIRALDSVTKRLDFADIETYKKTSLPRYKKILMAVHQKHPNYKLPPDEEILKEYGKSVQDQTASARFQVVAKEAELLEKDGNRNRALALVEAATRGLAPDSSVYAHAKTLTGHLKLMGNVAPSLKVDRKYGDYASLDAWRGKVVIIDSFAHWCGPCKASFPAMRKMYDDLHDKGLEIVGITGFYGFYGQDHKLDKDAEFARMDAFRKEQGMSWPLVFDDLSNFRTLGISAIPTTILIGRDGKVRGIETGFAADHFAALREEVEKELKAKP